ncbi:Uncharacterised protein [uncultured Clostridium sp.]|nr:Uncharacterised protein [uncultured Clostridium sp.]
MLLLVLDCEGNLSATLLAKSVIHPVLFSKGITASFPASPTIAIVGASTIPPLASLGIVGILIPFPPSPGIQSGSFILFKPLIIVFIASIIELIGFFAIFANPSNIPLNIFCTPCQAFCQFPVNTPTIKSTNPPNIVFKLSNIGFI